MKLIISLVLLLSLNGCLVSAVVGTAVDVTTAVVKAPFQVGSAIIDGVSGDDNNDEESDSKSD